MRPPCGPSCAPTFHAHGLQKGIRSSEKPNLSRAEIMSRRSRLDSFLSKKPSRRRGATKQRPAAGSFPFSRRLRFEPLEDRRLLSITVNSLIDEADGSIVDGDISLRDAIALAPAGETIDFSVTGTIDLNFAQLVIDKNLIISGPGASLLTINAGGEPGSPSGNSTRVFRIDDGNTGTLSNVEIRGLTLTGGDPDYLFGPQSGGAIWTSENLVVADCIITGNGTAVPQFSLGGGGGIYSSNGAALPNSLTVLDTTISGNVSNDEGGGIRKRYGSLVVERSTISGNTATWVGGGISAADGGINVQIRDSTISGNGAGVLGGGIFLSGTTTTITGSTISGNMAASDGGGIFGGDGLTVRHSTIAFNNADSDNNLTGQGGGLYTGSAILDHTIVAKNTRGGTTEDDVFDAVTANFSLISTTAGATINGANNVLGQDPRLGPLANNGGPTETHALLALSPAIDAGDSAAMGGIGTVPLSDQRGSPFSRIADGDGAGGTRIDIGAYERQNFNLVVDTLVDEDDGDHSAGDFSLREAIAFANTNDLVPDAITFAPNLTSGGPAGITLTLGELAITDSLSIEGPGAALLTIDGGDASRIFNIDNGSGALIDVEIVGLTLTGGNTTAGSGGAFSTRKICCSRRAPSAEIRRARAAAGSTTRAAASPLPAARLLETRHSSAAAESPTPLAISR